MNKKRLLIVLFGILALSLAYAGWRSPRQERVAMPEKRRPPANQKGTADSPPIAGDDLRVRLDLLNREKAGSVHPRRDLFASPTTGRRAVGAIVPPPPVAAIVATPPPEPVAEEPPPPPAPPLPVAVQFAFLGFLQKEVEKTVFLAEGKEIFIVKKGDRFGRNRQYFLSELTAEQLVIQHRENQQPITISLIDTSKVLPDDDFSRRDSRPPRPNAARSARLPQPSAGVPPSEEMAQEGSEPPVAEMPVDQGILRPISRSNFNNIFSQDKEQHAARPAIPPQIARPDLLMPSEEVPR